ncbi:hypothetical protein B296_00039930 [Ensete ventricosum]|uniref:Rx N-terminal domain-containing protein n=1 Tax=Ensete ventricosum TaxID=4639 RepID=A0A426Z704_ENSVE|nr:hypothetical protein B296_00039930 [Ensete ventricosum]
MALMAEPVVSYVVEKLRDYPIEAAVPLAGTGDERMKQWVKEIRDAAEEAEDGIDAYLLPNGNRRRTGVEGAIKRCSALRIRKPLLPHVEDAEVFGLENDQEKVVNMLLDDSKGGDALCLRVIVPAYPYAISTKDDDNINSRRTFDLRPINIKVTPKKLAEGIESLPGWCKRVRQKKTETHRKIVGGSRKACLTMAGSMKLQPDNRPRSSLSIRLGFRRCDRFRREFTRRFAEGIGKLSRNVRGRSPGRKPEDLPQVCRRLPNWWKLGRN